MDFSEIIQHLENLKLVPSKMGEFAVNGECIIYDEKNCYDSSEYDVMGVLEDFFGTVEIVSKNHPNNYDCWCVYGFMDHDVYLKYQGQSGYNMSWDKPQEVRPYEKTIIEYK